MIVVKYDTDLEFVAEHLSTLGVFRFRLTSAQRALIWSALELQPRYSREAIASLSGASLYAAAEMIREMLALQSERPRPGQSHLDMLRACFAQTSAEFVCAPTPENFQALLKSMIALTEAAP